MILSIGSGPGGQRFKSFRPDHFFIIHLRICVKYRKQWAEKVGLGVELPQVSESEPGDDYVATGTDIEFLLGSHNPAMPLARCWLLESEFFFFAHSSVNTHFDLSEKTT
jgi:hypothetical protein